jgi:hypothetical protein
MAAQGRYFMNTTIMDLLGKLGVARVREYNLKVWGLEYVSGCPACGGIDCFEIWPELGESGVWYCEGCEAGGDAVDFLRHFEGLSVENACEALGIDSKYYIAAQFPQSDVEPVPFFQEGPEGLGPSYMWKERAGELVKSAHRELLQNRREMPALAAYGLPGAAVERFRLGWLRGARDQKTGKFFDVNLVERAAWGLASSASDLGGDPDKFWLPRGLLIPTFDADGQVQRLQVRRPIPSLHEPYPLIRTVTVPGSKLGPLMLFPRAGLARV